MVRRTAQYVAVPRGPDGQPAGSVLIRRSRYPSARFAERALVAIDSTSLLSVIRGQLDTIEATQGAAIAEAADLIAASLAAGGVLQVFGTGHSEALAMELSGRAGGLIPTNKLALRDIVLLGGRDAAVLEDPKAERDSSLAGEVWDLAPIEPGDVVVIGSQSGGNGAIVEMAVIARAAGHPVVAVTSRAHSAAIDSRHPSGKRLFELADVVIDNGSPYGDSVLDLPDGGTVCAISSIGNAVVAQLLVAEITARLIAGGVEPPIYLSANIAEGDAHNDRWEARYAGRIRRTAY
jgi:uncharacterized phosphosugar-binding protein